jgi:hypothetical protein
MPLSGTGLKAKMSTSIKAGLARNFGDVSSTAGYAGISAQQWEKIADAVSDIALDIVTAITTEALVNPGIPTPSGPTTGPGTIS